MFILGKPWVNVGSFIHWGVKKKNNNNKSRFVLHRIPNANVASFKRITVGKISWKGNTLKSDIYSVRKILLLQQLCQNIPKIRTFSSKCKPLLSENAAFFHEADIICSANKSSMNKIQVFHKIRDKTLNFNQKWKFAMFFSLFLFLFFWPLLWTLFDP